MDSKVLETANDLTPDASNANHGSDRGRDLLRESIEQCGMGRGIFVDKHGVVIGGNKTLEVAREMGIPIRVVQTHGHELVVVRRTDLDLIEQPRARQMSYYDNRVQELDMKWSPQQVQADMLAGIDVTSSFFPEEVDRLIASIPPEPSPEDLMAGVEVSAGPVLDDDALATQEPTDPDLAEPKKKLNQQLLDVVELVFENITQQIRWSAFMRALRERYPDVPTQAERLSAYLTEKGFDA